MYFQISKLVLWRRSAVETKIYEFKPGKINIVFGHRHTGKSSILKIIDYSLGAEKMNIDQKVLKGASWVGIEIVTKDRRHLFARELPKQGKSKSPHCYHDHCAIEKALEIPALPKANKKPKEISGILNRICGIDFLEMPDTQGGTLKLSFRILIKLIKQDYQTLASEDELFADMDNPFVERPVKHWFPFFLGVQNEAFMRMQVEERSLSDKFDQMQKEKVRAANVSDKWKNRLYAQLQRAQQLGLYPDNLLLPKPSDTLALLEVAEKILEDKDLVVSPAISQTALETASATANKLISDLEKTAQDIQTCQQRLDELDQLKTKFNELQTAASKTHDRLQLATWIESAWTNYGDTLFDFHGSHAESEVRADIDKLKQALLQYEQTVMNRDKRLVFDNACKREEAFLSKTLETLCKRHRSLSDKIKAIKDEHVRIASQREAFMLLGRLLSTVELTKALSEANVSESELNTISEQLSALRTNIDTAKAESEKCLDEAIASLSGDIHTKVNCLQLEESIKDLNVKFDLATLDLKLSDPVTGATAHLSEHGSTNNHIAFHVATTVALQEYFAKRPTSPVPGFVLYDQPGQSSEPEQNEETTEEEALSKIFEVLHQSLVKTEGYWQPIVIDLANSDTYKDIPKEWVHCVDEFYNGHGLIPDSWFSKE